MGLLAWFKSKSAGERMLASAFLAFEKGDEPDAMTELLLGVAELAGPGTKVAAVAQSVLAKAVNFGLAAAPKPENASTSTAVLPGLAPASEPAPVVTPPGAEVAAS